MHEMEIFKKLADGSLLLYRNGLVAGTAGNLSARIPDTTVIAITPSGIPYENYTDEMIMCVVDQDGNKLEGRYEPSSETPMHTILLKSLPHVNAIVHTHSPFATAIGSTGGYVPVMGLEGLHFGTNRILTTDGFVLPGSDQMGIAVLNTLNKSPNAKAVLLQNHGVVIFGETISEAVSLAQAVEFCAKIYCLARIVGTPHELTEKEINDSLAHYAEKKRQAQIKNGKEEG